MTLLRAEEGNLMHALRLARRHACWDDVAEVLYGLNRLLTTQGRWVEWERLITDVEAEATDTGGEPLTGREPLWRALLGHRQEMAYYRRDFDTQETILHRLKDHYEHAGDDHNHAVALHQLGSVARSGGSSRKPSAGIARAWPLKSASATSTGKPSPCTSWEGLRRSGGSSRKPSAGIARAWLSQSASATSTGKRSPCTTWEIIAQERRQLEEAERWLSPEPGHQRAPRRRARASVHPAPVGENCAGAAAVRGSRALVSPEPGYRRAPRRRVWASHHPAPVGAGLHRSGGSRAGLTKDLPLEIKS